MRRAALGLALAALFALPASAQAADPLWSVKATASGSYSLDYGDDGDQIDGQGTGTWRWRLKAVAEGLNVDTGTAAFRMTFAEASDIVIGGSTPHCRPAPGETIGWVRDSRVGLYLSTSRGFQVNHPYFTEIGGCHLGAHGMSLYDGASPADTRIPRGAFRPRRARTFKRTWTQEIVLDRTHESGTPHTFMASGTLTIRLERISERAARVLERRLRRVPGSGS